MSGTRRGFTRCSALAAGILWLGCGAEAPEPPPAGEPAATVADRAELRQQALSVFRSLPEVVENPLDPSNDARVDLGRMLYYDARLSKNHDVSCNTCHLLSKWGVDGEPTSIGHRGQRGGRNAPTSLNAALHLAQFWDGRAADVEAQAKGPPLNPIEMAMPSEAAVVAVLESIPGYAPLFAAAFPDEAEPISYDNMARAIGAFERGLLTPGPLDDFMAGDDDALTDEQVAGLDDFIGVGCVSCHMGPAVGGTLYRKLGFVKPYPVEDPGREAVTGQPADRHVFKVPGLRNVENTGPWFHDGSLTDLAQVIRIMGEHQLGRTLTDEQVASLRVFLGVLTGRVDEEYVAEPELPASGPDTPAPDPS
jgi:cytochrome c peroxidase